MIYCEVVEEENENIKVYGLKFSDAESGEAICTISDVFTDRQKAVSFRDTVNTSEVCREHIRDIIEDVIAT